MTEEEPKCPEEVEEEAKIDPNDGTQKAESDKEEPKGKFIGFVGADADWGTIAIFLGVLHWSPLVRSTFW